MSGYENDLVRMATNAIIVVGAPAGIGASVVWGALNNRGPRRNIGVTLVLLTIAFIVTILDKIFDIGIFFAIFRNDIDLVILSFPPIIAMAWIYLIINYPLNNKAIDRLGLYGLALSLSAILFYLLVLN